MSDSAVTVAAAVVTVAAVTAGGALGALALWPPEGGAKLLTSDGQAEFRHDLVLRVALGCLAGALFLYMLR